MAPRLFRGDEELGKKDDDHRPRKSSLGAVWQGRRLSHGPLRRSMKRVAIGALALVGLYYFFKNMPTDLRNPRPRPSYIHKDIEFPANRPTSAAEQQPSAPTKQSLPAKPHPALAEEETLHDFNGPIKFYDLASSLHAVSNTKGTEFINKNVLFAAASLKSTATLLPIACDMAVRDRNYVHFAFMGRDDISMDLLRAVNGVSKECKIIFHDARPDFSMHSTDFRMEVSVSAGFNHINNFLHPQATLVDGSGDEEQFFIKSIKQRAASLGRSVIELPENVEQHLMWATMLDSQSLSAWNKVSLDIVIHAQTSASGSLIRLLNSLKKADFFSSAPPRLTIELPPKIDMATKKYLEGFRWPPRADHNSGSLLTLHHRIPQHVLSPDENSIRFVESFWPTDPIWSHVLVLSPSAELSPLFFHYLKYTILEYRYSTNKAIFFRNLLGISLDLPSTYLNESSSFSPPISHDSPTTSFLWQAPNSNAVLYFGEKWVELHDFIARMLGVQDANPTHPMLNGKSISKFYPSWLEYILRLARARGYWTLYPNFGADALATMHDDLYQPPEEFEHDIQTEHEYKYSTSELTADPQQHFSLKHKEPALITKSLLNMLPFNGELPSISDMPLIGWDGENLDIERIGSNAVIYRTTFRKEVGGCNDAGELKVKDELSAADLFCLKDSLESGMDGRIEAES